MLGETASTAPSPLLSTQQLSFTALELKQRPACLNSLVTKPRPPQRQAASVSCFISSPSCLELSFDYEFPWRTCNGYDQRFRSEMMSLVANYQSFTFVVSEESNFAFP